MGFFELENLHAEHCCCGTNGICPVIHELDKCHINVMSVDWHAPGKSRHRTVLWKKNVFLYIYFLIFLRDLYLGGVQNTKLKHFYGHIS